RAGGEVEAAGAGLGDHRDAHLAGHEAVEQRLWETAYLVAKHEVVARRKPRFPQASASPPGKEVQARRANSFTLQQLVERAPRRRMDLVPVVQAGAPQILVV